MIRFRNIFEMIYWPLVLIVIIHRYVSPETFFVINAAILCFFIFVAGKIRINIIWGILLLLSFLLWGSLTGMDNLSNNNGRDFLRDLYYYISPIVFMFNASFYAKRGVSFTKFANSLLVANVVQALLSILQFLQGNDFRAITTYIPISIAMLLANKFYGEESFTKIQRFIMFIILLIPAIAVMSRTTIVTVIVMFTCLVWDKNILVKIADNILKNFLKYLAVIFLGIIIFTTMVSEKDKQMYMDKIENSVNEITVSQDWNDPEVVIKNWRGYEMHCVMKEFKGAKLNDKLFGHGFGKRIDVGKYAHSLLLQQNMDGQRTNQIAIVHNGYGGILIKMGAFGIVIYCLFFLNGVRKGVAVVKKYNKCIEARLYIGCMISFLINTYFLFGLYSGIWYFSITTTIGFVGYRLKNKYYLNEVGIEEVKDK